MISINTRSSWKFKDDINQNTFFAEKDSFYNQTQ